jgi:hypothetical protein
VIQQEIGLQRPHLSPNLPEYEYTTKIRTIFIFLTIAKHLSYQFKASAAIVPNFHSVLLNSSCAGILSVLEGLLNISNAQGNGWI